MKRAARWMLILGCVAIAVAMIATAGVYGMLRASLAVRSGTVEVVGLTDEVRIEWDERGVPTIRAEGYLDAVRAMGFVHGQERFFQMDMARRLAAGRLSEVLGGATIRLDSHLRHYRFEHVADQMLAAMGEEYRALGNAYTEGVNAGLGALGARPPEYFALRVKPEAWRARDVLLVNANMHLGLSLFGNYELEMDRLVAALPEEMVEFLTPRVTRFDAALVGEAGEFEPAAIPGPEVLDLRGADVGEGVSDAALAEPIVLGSNSFAVGGSRTADGRAILANDMHLMHTAPNIWYRCVLVWRDGAGAERRAVGVTLPGVPGIIVGSNGDVAWGMTNVTGDFVDYVVVEEAGQGRYHTPDGPEAFSEVVETIRVKGGDSVEVALRTTRWGVVSERESDGRPLVLKWTALEAERNNIDLINMVHARSLEEAVGVARRWRGPPQNVLLASADGRIAWVVAGDLPKRIGFDGTRPVSWADGSARWEGSLDESVRPVVVDPESGVLHTANNRTLPLGWADDIGHNWAPGMRAGRIRDLLGEKETLSERDLLSIQLDTRLEAFDFYRDLVLEITDKASKDMLVAARQAVERWDGRAEADSVGLVLLEEFRARLKQAALAPIGDSGVAGGVGGESETGLQFRWLNVEEPLRRLLEERPAHLLGAAHESWDALMRKALETAVEDLRRDYPKTGEMTAWGDAHRSLIQHPISAALGRRLGLLDMPEHGLAGHSWCVRVAGASFGASERLVVSPGREAEGIFQMPTGQSGHFLSQHYRDGHADWVGGEASPLIRERIVSTTTLVPSGK